MKKITICFLIFFFSAFFHQSFSQPSVRAHSVFNRNSNLPHFSLNFNPVSMALYGPIIKAEIKLANRLYLAPFIRYLYAGLISTYNWTNNEDDNKYYPSSIGFGAGPKGFIIIKTSKQYLYYGIFNEYIMEKGLHNTDEYYYEYEQTRTAIAIYANIGYRWTSKRHFYFDLGILPSYVFDLKNEATFTLTGGPYNDIKKGNRFVGMLDVSFGWSIVK